MSNFVTLPTGKIWIPIVEVVHNVCQTVVTNQRISMRSNSILFQNNGNCDVILDSGFTIKPDQSYQFGDTQPSTVVILETIARFDEASATGSPVVKRLQITQIQSKFSGSGFYIDTPPAQP